MPVPAERGHLAAAPDRLAGDGPVARRRPGRRTGVTFRTRIRMTRHCADQRRIHRTAYAVSGLEYAGVARGLRTEPTGRAGWVLVTSRVEEGRCRVDRCALFVDAGYMLADGATAVHGTSSRDSVSWDYAGLLRFLARLSADRTGQPLLRCYWYEATVDGRRTPEHDTLADLPGLTLRLGRMQPGQRDGVEAEIHRDLTTLARNRAISDVLLV